MKATYHPTLRLPANYSTHQIIPAPHRTCWNGIRAGICTKPYKHAAGVMAWLCKELGESIESVASPSKEAAG